MTAVETQRSEGRALRVASWFSSGVRTVRAQIDEFEAAWIQHNSAVLESLKPTDRLIVAVGDSLSQGIGAATLATTWPMRLVADAALGPDPTRLINLSVTGARLRDVTEHQMPALGSLGVAPDVITCTAGSNDLFKSARFGRATRDLAAMADALATAAAGGEVVLATIPDGASLIARSFNRRVRRVAEEHAITVADVAPLAALSRHALAPDRFHPNDLGYQAWSKAFTAALIP